MKTCLLCAEQLDDGLEVCGHCGEAQRTSAATTAARAEDARATGATPQPADPAHVVRRFLRSRGGRVQLAAVGVIIVLLVLGMARVARRDLSREQAADILRAGFAPHDEPILFNPNMRRVPPRYTGWGRPEDWDRFDAQIKAWHVDRAWSFMVPLDRSDARPLVQTLASRGLVDVHGEVEWHDGSHMLVFTFRPSVRDSIDDGQLIFCKMREEFGEVTGVAPRNENTRLVEATIRIVPVDDQVAKALDGALPYLPKGCIPKVRRIEATLRRYDDGWRKSH